MKILLKILKKISDVLEKFAGYLCMVLITVMLAVVMIQVILRAARASVPWSEELSRILLVWIGMLGAGIAAKQGLHVGVDLLLTILPRKISRYLGILIKGVVIWFLVFFAEHSYLSTLNGLRVKATTLEITLFFPKLALPVGSVLILIHLAYLFVSDLYSLVSPNSREAA